MHRKGIGEIGASGGRAELTDYLSPNSIHPERIDRFPGFDSIRPGITGSFEDFIRKLAENECDFGLCPTCGQPIPYRGTNKEKI